MHNATEYCTKSIFCGIDALTVLSYGKQLSSHCIVSLSGDNRHMPRNSSYLTEYLSQILIYSATLILLVRVQLYVFSVLFVFLTACIINQHAVAQNNTDFLKLIYMERNFSHTMKNCIIVFGIPSILWYCVIPT